MNQGSPRPRRTASTAATRRWVSGSGVRSSLTNDFLQYHLGAFLYISDAGLDPNGDPFPIVGSDEPFAGPPASGWTLGGGSSADNQAHNASFLATSGILDPATFPQFESWISAKWDRPGGPFAPHTGDFYTYSQIADITYKRLAHTINVPACGATMSFWTSYDTEADWVHVFVEAHTVGQDNWTTLPDLNGHTTQATGESRKAENSGGWRTLHPHLDHYQTQTGPRPVTRPKPPVRGTPRRGTPPAGSSGRSTWAPGGTRVHHRGHDLLRVRLRRHHR